MDSFIDAIQYFLDWTSTGIYEFTEQALKEATAWYVVGVVKAKIYMIGFAWDVAKIVLQNIGLSQFINATWGNLSPQLIGYLTFFKVPDALNVLIQAYVTRFVLNIIGW